ncbi:MAG TPA: serine protease [Candidatus Obscuribacterales bacterium]
MVDSLQTKGHWQDARQGVFRFDSETGHGSTWKIDDSTYATDAHVVTSGRQGFLIGHDGNRYPLGADVWVDRARDIAFYTLAPGQKGPDAQPLPLGDSQKLKAGDQVHTLGFGGDLYFPQNEPKTYPGTLVDRLGKHVPKSLQFDLEYDSSAVEGVSGGADVDRNGKLISMPDSGRAGLLASTPVERIVAAYNDRQNLAHFSGHYENGWQALGHDIANKPWLNGTKVGFYGVNVGSGLLSILTRQAGVPLSSTLLMGLGPLTVLGYRSYLDVDALAHSTNDRDTWKYRLAAAADAVMGIGAALMFSRFAPIARVIAATGIAGRLGAEFSPNNYVVDYDAKPS